MSRITVSSAIILVVGSSCLAGLVHDQVTSIGLTNAIDLLHGTQQAGSLQNLVVHNEQSADGTAVESLFASLGEVGNAQGNCALLGVDQLVNITGVQGQNVGDCLDPKSQLQTLGVAAGQMLARADGEGGADALHTIVLTAGQSADNAAGNLTENQTIMGMQTPTVAGAAGSTSAVRGVMNVMTAQSQASL
jgi:hypothetical protein